MKARDVIARIEADTHTMSGVVRHHPTGAPCPEIYIAFPHRGGMWIRGDGSYVSGWTDHGAYHWQYFGLFNRLRIRKAIREWIARRQGDNA